MKGCESLNSLTEPKAGIHILQAPSGQDSGMTIVLDITKMVGMNDFYEEDFIHHFTFERYKTKPKVIVQPSDPYTLDS